MGLRLRLGSCWEKQKRIVFPRQGVIELPSWQVNDFLQIKETEKIELAAKPGDGQEQLKKPPPSWKSFFNIQATQASGM